MALNELSPMAVGFSPNQKETTAALERSCLHLSTLRHFRSYLLGHPFIVRTDHAALQWIQSFKEPEGQIARWLEQLQEFQFQTEHRQGKKYQNAHAMSRIHCRQCGLNHSTGQGSETCKIENVNAVTTTYTWTPAWSTQELWEAQRSDPTTGLAEERSRPTFAHSY